MSRTCRHIPEAAHSNGRMGRVHGRQPGQRLSSAQWGWEDGLLSDCAESWI
jgi:hypothetical protein